MAKATLDISALSDSDRLQLIQELWVSLGAKDHLPISEAQAQELDARATALDAGALEFLPFEEVVAALRFRRV